MNSNEKVHLSMNLASLYSKINLAKRIISSLPEHRDRQMRDLLSVKQYEEYQAILKNEENLRLINLTQIDVWQAEVDRLDSILTSAYNQV